MMRAGKGFFGAPVGRLEMVEHLATASHQLDDGYAEQSRCNFKSFRRGSSVAMQAFLGRTPSVAADNDYRFYALRDIKKGEELTVNQCPLALDFSQAAQSH